MKKAFIIFSLVVASSVAFVGVVVSMSIHTSRPLQPPKIVWQILPVEKENTIVQNQIPENCSSMSSLASDAAINAEPPLVQQFAKINIDSDVTAIAWSPNGELFATSEDFDTVIKIWSFPDLQLLFTIHKKYRGSEKLSFTADSDYLVTASAGDVNGLDDTAFSIIDVHTGKIVKNVAGPYDPYGFARADIPADFVRSLDGKLFFVTFRDGGQHVYVYSTKDWSLIDEFNAPALALQAGPGAEQLTIASVPVYTGDSSQSFIRPDPFLIWDESKKSTIFSMGLMSGLFSPEHIVVAKKIACSFLVRLW